MATRIVNNIPALVFTKDLGTITAYTTADGGEFDVYVDGYLALRSRSDAVGSYMRLYELGAALEDILAEKRSAVANIVLTVIPDTTDDGETQPSSEFVVVACPFQHEHSAINFCAARFLAPLSYCQMCKPGMNYISFIQAPDEDVTVEAWINYYDTNNELRQETATLASWQSQHEYKLHTITLELDKLIDDATPVSIVIKAGPRTFTFYFKHINPQLQVVYLNHYHAPEILQLRCSTKTVSKASLETAFSLGSKLKYDRKIEKEYQITVAPMPFQLALSLDGLFQSPATWLLDESQDSYLDMPEIIITESTLEPSDLPSETFNAKFTYTTANRRPNINPAITTLSTRIHSDQFSEPYA